MAVENAEFVWNIEVGVNILFWFLVAFFYFEERLGARLEDSGFWGELKFWRSSYG